MFIRMLPLLIGVLIAGCDQAEKQPEQEGVQRQLIQGMHAEFFKVADGSSTWFEVAISVDNSKTFRMPVFFSQNGKLVKVTDSQAQSIFDSWLKERAKNIAAFGSLDEQSGMKDPFLALDVNRWEKK
ncbi:hypothetical protein PL963_P100035 (plasmid) [Pseudomonas cerasi]|uniref:Uncharacterized protein n=1 Tax=Pseudomonas cerasi TaxID=1583341 RepID=A0A2K4W2A1_9PSED|nr:hypothetical protein [Pseudomonas cerasi]SOS30018.1 hypothetical protein PL963_P100035 [Pseudomonas cerasi]